MEFPAMRVSRWLAATSFILALGAGPVSAAPLAEVRVHNRADGRELAVYWHEGRRHIAGEPGEEYEIRIHNRDGGRVLAVTSVDGVNVLSGETAAPDQSGYTVSPWSTTRIDGWRKSLSEVASFHFTRLPDSYAARTGRPDDVGVIGVALFRERVPTPCCRHFGDDRDGDEGGRYRPESAPADPAQGGSRAAPSAQDSAAAAPSQRKSERLGTGHGQRLDSSVRYVDFERASSQPDEVISIWYDARSRLVAQGIVTKSRRTVQRRPDPFPAGFVPDP